MPPGHTFTERKYPSFECSRGAGGTMKKFLLKRFLIAIPVLIGLSMIIFALINLTPGDPYTAMLDPSVDPADRENMLQSIGYYDPLPVKYVKWVGRALQGDLGYSIRYKAPVTEVISQKVGNTLMLSVTALVLSALLAVPLGIISATKQYTLIDYLSTILAFIGISIPSFFLALGMIKIFGIDLKIFPINGIEYVAKGFTGFRRFLDILHHMALPVIVLTLIQTASLMRYTRSAMLEIINQDFIRTARAKGLSERVTIYTHALRNAMIPVITILSSSLGGLLSGAILVETVFSWPGMGTLVYQAISNRDYPLIMGGTMLLAVCVLLANLLADILYAVVDPRIRLE